ncbi:uncharacterized protein LOC128384063 [Scomber scombrus]|uniref:Uncharacterized protein LOC128384063 n=1 Tax=Scomber scombrus TaxID=13677 RepID=A0AAV1PXZ2_SCOSC
MKLSTHLAVETSRSCWNDTEGSQNKSKSDDPESQCLNYDPDGPTVSQAVSNDKQEGPIVSPAVSEQNKVTDSREAGGDEIDAENSQDLQKEIQTLKGELEKKKEELKKKKQAELLKEKQNRENSEREVKDLKNQVESTLKKDLKLEGWRLRVKLNDENPIMFTFEESFTLRAERRVTIWVPGFVTHPSPSDLVWKDLNRWNKGDKLIVELINCHEEIVKTTKV